MRLKFDEALKIPVPLRIAPFNLIQANLVFS